jgi:hypothetical protein
VAGNYYEFRLYTNVGPRSLLAKVCCYSIIFKQLVPVNGLTIIALDSTIAHVQRILPLSLGIAIYCSVLNACDGGRHHPTQDATSGKPLLSAEPNPVPAGDPDQALGTTVITWNTASQATGDLYVKANRSPGIFMGRARSGTLKINWIQFDSTYEFRLYAGHSHRKVLAKVDVTRDD